MDVYNLPVRVEEERANAFERKDGFNYFVRFKFAMYTTISFRREV